MTQVLALSMSCGLSAAVTIYHGFSSAVMRNGTLCHSHADQEAEERLRSEIRRDLNQGTGICFQGATTDTSTHIIVGPKRHVFASAV
jgi:hypothetical protein